jgi:hypothetical protein
VKFDIFLSGLVSGLTILLGVIFADWLKRLRDRVEASRLTASVILVKLGDYMDYLVCHTLEGDFLDGVEKSRDEKEFIACFNEIIQEIETLAELPRWPQQNARQIREAANHLVICILANTYHCRAKRVRLQPENIKELTDLAFDLRDLNRSSLDRKTLRSSVLDKREELERQALSREVPSPL